MLDKVQYQMKCRKTNRSVSVNASDVNSICEVNVKDSDRTLYEYRIGNQVTVRLKLLLSSLASLI